MRFNRKCSPPATRFGHGQTMPRSEKLLAYPRLDSDAVADHIPGKDKSHGRSWNKNRYISRSY